MKRLFIASTITVLLTTSVLSMPKTHGSDIATNICEYVASDNKKRLRSFLKSNKLKLRSVFKELSCNGINLLMFAATSGSVKTGTMIISKLPKKIVSANLSSLEGASKPLFDVANKRVGS